MSKKTKRFIDENGQECSKCKEYKLWNEFTNETSSKTGKCDICKKCQQEYYQERKEERLQYAEQYRSDPVNIEKQKDYQAKYREDNKEKLRKQKRECARKWLNKSAKYKTYAKYLTVLESPRETEDGYLEVKCAKCRDYYIPTNQEARNRKDSLNGKRRGESRLYCSEECKENCEVYHQSSSPKNFKHKLTGREVDPVWREMVLEQDDYTCQKCGKTNVQLDAHHILPVVSNEILQNDVDNGITLCKECHKEIHQLEGCTLGELSQCGREKAEKRLLETNK